MRSIVVALLCLLPASLVAQNVRIMPPNNAQFLQFQRFDVRVEFSAADGTTLGDVRVTLDGRDITSTGAITTSAPNAKAWTFRSMYLGYPGERRIGASVTTVAAAPVTQSAVSAIFVRTWSTTRGVSSSRAPSAIERQIGLKSETAADALDPASPQPLAKNVILLIGDGMGIGHRTAARVLSKGYTQGKANALMAMDRLPFNGLMMTSSLDALVTDSAPGAHAYATGNKTNNGMEGVFPDNTDAEDDNPRIENLAEWIARNFGMVTGIVSDAYLTDATPAAMIAHTQNRANGTLIASQYADTLATTNLKVLLGGGSYHFIPKSQAGSRRSDERNILNELKAAGFDFVETRSALNSYSAGANRKLLGLFHLDNMNVAFDKLKLGDPSVVSSFPDQPFLPEMARAAIDVLEQYPNGFFLLVEGAHIDKQAHAMDAERSIYDVIQLDQAVGVALDFAASTNSDADPNNDTLVVVTADHESSGVVLPGVGNPTFKGASARDYVKAYGYSAARNDPATANFTDYSDANGDGYPDNPDAPRKLIVSFGANSDHYEDWISNARPKSPGTQVNNISIANPNDPDRTAPGAMLVSGVISNGERGSEAFTTAVHTAADIAVSAVGPGASQFSRVSDNTEAFFYIVNAITGRYPVPPQY